jgi:hypothetical protein
MFQSDVILINFNFNMMSNSFSFFFVLTFIFIYLNTQFVTMSSSQNQSQSTVFFTQNVSFFKRHALTSKWRFVSVRLKVELKVNVLRFEKLFKNQMKKLIRRVIQSMNLNEKNIIYHKIINKIKINQFTWKHRSLKIMKTRTNHSNYQMRYSLYYQKHVTTILNNDKLNLLKQMIDAQQLFKIFVFSYNIHDVEFVFSRVAKHYRFDNNNDKNFKILSSKSYWIKNMIISQMHVLMFMLTLKQRFSLIWQSRSNFTWIIWKKKKRIDNVCWIFETRFQIVKSLITSNFVISNESQRE